MSKITWVLVNCNSKEEAERIGKEILKKRLISCFDIISRFLAAYFWPPNAGKIEASKGAILILETIGKESKIIEKEVKKLHSDKLPFIGSIGIKVGKEYSDWVKGEIKK